MPEIKDYTSPVEGLAPQSRGSEAFAQEGRRVGAFYHQMGADAANLVDTYEQHQQDEEKRHLLASSVQLEQNLHDSWQAAANDPKNAGNSALATQYMQAAHQQIEDWSSHATTREGKLMASSRAAEIEQHLFERTAAEQSVMTATHAVGQIHGALGSLTGMVARDPSQADYAIGTGRSIIDGMLPTTGIDPATRARVVEELNTAHQKDVALTYYDSSLGAIRSQYATGATSSAAEDQLRKDMAAGKFSQYVEGTEMAKLPALIDQAKREGTEEYHAVQSGQQRQDEIAYTAKATQISTTISDAIAGGQPITGAMLQARDELVRDPKAAGLIGPKIDEINGLIRDGVKAQADHTFVVTNPHVSADLLGRLTLPAGDPRAITEAELVHDVANNQLSQDDYSMYHQALPKITGDPQAKADMRTMEQWVEGFKARITGNGQLPGGATAFAQFKHDAMFQWMQWNQTEGPKAVEIMTNGNNPRNFGQMVDEYARAARTNDPMAALNKIPGYGRLSGAAEGSVVSPLLGPTPAPAASPAAKPPGPIDAKTLGDMSRIAGGN